MEKGCDQRAWPAKAGAGGVGCPRQKASTIRDVAHRARAWALGGAERLAYQVREIGFVLALGLGGLDKHDCYAYSAPKEINTRIKYTIYLQLLATKRFLKLRNTRQN